MSRRLALLATFTAACGGQPAPATTRRAEPMRADAGVVAPVAVAIDAAPPRPLDQDLPRLAARAVELLRAVRAALDAAGDDCDAAAAKLGDVQHAFTDVLEANAAIARADRKAELAAALAPQQAALDAAGAAVYGAHTLGACADKPAFAVAFDRALGGP